VKCPRSSRQLRPRRRPLNLCAEGAAHQLGGASLSRPEHGAVAGAGYGSGGRGHQVEAPREQLTSSAGPRLGGAAAGAGHVEATGLGMLTPPALAYPSAAQLGGRGHQLRPRGSSSLLGGASLAGPTRASCRPGLRPEGTAARATRRRLVLRCAGSGPAAGLGSGSEGAAHSSALPPWRGPPGRAAARPPGRSAEGAAHQLGAAGGAGARRGERPGHHPSGAGPPSAALLPALGQAAGLGSGPEASGSVHQLGGVHQGELPAVVATSYGPEGAAPPPAWRARRGLYVSPVTYKGALSLSAQVLANAG